MVAVNKLQETRLVAGATRALQAGSSSGEVRQAVDDFRSFDEAYRNADWSAYADLPAFEASNRGNAFRVFLELEAESFD